MELESFLLDIQEEIVRLEIENEELRKVIDVKNNIIKQLERSLLDDGKVYKIPLSCEIEKKNTIGCIGSKERLLENIKNFLLQKRT